MSVKQDAMPAVGFGLWKIDKSDTAGMVCQAIKAGYRHLDSAADYGNEAEVGDGIRQAIEQGLCTRQDLWLTSKLWNTFHRPEHVREACEKTLADLGVDYLDLYLVHFPIALKYVPIGERYPPEWIFNPDDDNPEMVVDPVPLSETWRAMEALVQAGLVRNIGVCNYNSALLHDLMAYASIKPAMLQIESHPYLTQARLVRLAQSYELAVTAFSPLGAGSYVELEMASQQESVLGQSVVLDIARRVQRTPAQVVLRWGVQRGTAVIPKTSRVERLAENLAIFDFELSDDDMVAISELNRNRRFNDPGTFCEQAFGRFYPIYD
ncbi:4-dihydromethyl-trisporate dehydrogenase [Pseudohongiella acticola]|uniref:4-dihydromethyl-trisporate dehydrogenase n=1 Tax=Pseudohongiella acticola TaxID=1524254 RepID=A0A1E8CNN4_9GAMM|nr:4-dihydromethyl-trisporate dehydrogenase [Pseudohongiella acticola]